MLHCTIERVSNHVQPNQTRLRREILSVIGNALATRRPSSQGAEPKARNLRGLGIDPAEFRKISHYY